MPPIELLQDIKTGMRVQLVRKEILSISLMGEDVKTYDYTNVQEFATRYLQTYYTQVDPDERIIAEFLVREYRKLSDMDKPAMIEVGCGPTIHHVLPATPYISRIDMMDFLPGNVEQVRLWKEGSAQAHDWRHFVKMILEMEGERPSMRDIEERETLLRSRIGRLGHCDVLQDQPLGKKITYPVVGFFYVAEEAAIDKEEWKNVMRRVLNIVEPGGRFFLAALRATHFYSIVRPNGLHESLPTAYVLESDLAEVLEEMNFDMSETIIESAQTPEQIEHGIPGVILVSAKRK